MPATSVGEWCRKITAGRKKAVDKSGGKAAIFGGAGDTKHCKIKAKAVNMNGGKAVIFYSTGEKQEGSYQLTVS